MEIVKTTEGIELAFYDKCKTYKIPSPESLGIPNCTNIILRTADQIYYSTGKVRQNKQNKFYWLDGSNVYIYSLVEKEGKQNWTYQYSYAPSRNEVDSLLNSPGSNTKFEWANYDIYNDTGIAVLKSTEVINLDWMVVIDWDGNTEDGDYETIDNKVYQKIDKYEDIKDFLIQFEDELPTNKDFRKENTPDGWKIYDNRNGLEELIAYGHIPRFKDDVQTVTTESGEEVGEYTEEFIDGGIFFLAQSPAVRVCFCYHFDNYLRPRQRLKDGLVEIANAIRDKTYYQGQIYLEDMPDKIRDIVSYRTVTATQFTKNGNIVVEESALEDGSGFKSTIEFDQSTGLAKTVTGAEGKMDIEIVRNGMGKAEKVIINDKEFTVSWLGEFA